MARTVALYGGSFNPVHIGHLCTMLYVSELLDVESVLIAPAYQHPEGKDLVPFEHRVNMLLLATERLPSRIKVDLLDKENWEAGGRGLTCNALDLLLARGYDKVVLVMGFDLKNVFQSWEGVDKINALVAAKKVEIHWVERSGSSSSTLARMSMRLGRSTRRLLQPAVRTYIRDHGLYIR